MASISREPNGRRTIQFVAADGKRRSIRLGKVTQRTAEEIKGRVEQINAAAISGCAVDGETARWLAGIADELAGKLAAAGLIAPRASANARLKPFVDSYIESRADVKHRTKLNLEICARRLVEFFSADKLLREVRPGDADEFCSWLRARYATATAARTIKRAKQFFQAAARKDFIPKNPFAHVKAGHQSNTSRLFFVSREVAQRVLDACPDAEWRLIFTLSRFGGLRCPSEHLALEWSDIDWERGRFRVHSSKQEHQADGGERWVPIFPELRSHLEAAFEQAPEGTVYIIRRYRDASANLRTQLNRIIKRAGLTPWPKTFHNLRATRQTELAAEFPLHVVCAWIGNQEAVAMEHYLQVTDADFDRAVKPGAESGAQVVQNPVQHGAAPTRTEAQEKRKTLEKPGLLQVDAAACEAAPTTGIPPRGLEPLS